MNQETGIVKYQGQMTISDLRTLAGDFAKSNYFQDAKEMAQAVVKIQAGIELGFGPVYSMTKIYIVKGKVMVSAEALGAMVKRSNRYDYTVKSLTDTECILDFTDTGKSVYTSKFNMEDARRADLVKPDSGWMKWPRAMLMSKALSQGARIVCPHVISGVYTPEDFGLEPDEEGNIVDSEATSPPPVAMITDAQRKKIFATVKEKGLAEADIHEHIQKTYSKYHLADLTKDEAKDVIEAIANTPQKESAPEESKQSEPESPPEPEQENQEPQYDFDTAWLKESLAKAKWTDTTVKSYLKNTYQVNIEGTVVEVIARLNREQREAFFKELEKYSNKQKSMI